MGCGSHTLPHPGIATRLSGVGPHGSVALGCPARDKQRSTAERAEHAENEGWRFALCGAPSPAFSACSACSAVDLTALRHRRGARRLGTIQPIGPGRRPRNAGPRLPHSPAMPTAPAAAPPPGGGPQFRRLLQCCNATTALRCTATISICCTAANPLCCAAAILWRSGAWIMSRLTSGRISSRPAACGLPGCCTTSSTTRRSPAPAWTRPRSGTASAPWCATSRRATGRCWPSATSCRRRSTPGTAPSAAGRSTRPPTSDFLREIGYLVPEPADGRHRHRQCRSRDRRDRRAAAGRAGDQRPLRAERRQRALGQPVRRAVRHRRDPEDGDAAAGRGLQPGSAARR